MSKRRQKIISGEKFTTFDGIDGSVKKVDVVDLKKENTKGNVCPNVEVIEKTLRKYRKILANPSTDAEVREMVELDCKKLYGCLEAWEKDGKATVPVEIKAEARRLDKNLFKE